MLVASWLAGLLGGPIPLFIPMQYENISKKQCSCDSKLRINTSLLRYLGEIFSPIKGTYFVHLSIVPTKKIIENKHTKYLAKFLLKHTLYQV